MQEMLEEKVGTACGELAVLKIREFRDVNFSGYRENQTKVSVTKCKVQKGLSIQVIVTG